MRDMIIHIPDPADDNTFAEYDIYTEAMYTPGLNIDREAAAIEQLIAANVEQQLINATPKRWKLR